ncbi:PepSY-associated TM helix domain-containing protein [Tsuneonella sp. HG222]
MATTANSTTVRLRRMWFQVHKWIGLILAAVIIPICLTGSALVWHDWLEGTLNPERATTAAADKPAQFYADAARRALAPGEARARLTWPESGSGPVLAAASLAGPPRGGRPVFAQYWLDPVDGRVLDTGRSDAGAVHVMHVLHGSLMIPGMGRKIVGWIGWAMLASSLTGLWLWWPFKGGFRRGLRWKRMPTTSGNLHHQGGFWIALPLAVLSFTGAWISFPAFFGPLAGDGPGGPPPGARGAPAPLLERTALSPDTAASIAAPLAPGELRTIAWPTAPDGQWTLTYDRDGGRAEVKVADATGELTPPDPPRPETTARLMRRFHDGTDMGVVWQIVIFLGGLIPAGLAVTGVMMWLRGRRVKGSVRAAYAAHNRGLS